MKLFKGSHSIAMSWMIFFGSLTVSIILKDAAIFMSGMGFATALVTNKTYQKRKENE